MKRCLALLLAGLVMLTALVLTGGQRPSDEGSGDLLVSRGEPKPRTSAPFPAGDTFHFAVVGDRTGAPRRGVFEKAVVQLNRLRPAFVLSVGDLIQGYSDDAKIVSAQWREFENSVNKLTMPFFYTPGNHDISNDLQETIWHDRLGRRYGHFVYRNVLFLLLNSEDPPASGGRLSSAQLAYAAKTLSECRSVAWTVVVLHRPLWDQDDIAENGWLPLEAALEGRKYTVFAGHEHSYRKFVRKRMAHYQLATTGGGSELRGVPHGEFDHFAWVTMTKDGPVVANVLLDGVLSDEPTR